jgi:microcystin-dependent protein
MATNPVTITPSTSVVLINTADYVTNPIVLLPPIDAIGRIITIRDNDGGSTGKPITISTTTGARFQPELSSITTNSISINQPYGFITLTPRYVDSSGILNYGLMNIFAFPDTSPVAAVNTLDADTGYFSTINGRNLSLSQNLYVEGNTTISGNVIVSSITSAIINTTNVGTDGIYCKELFTSSLGVSTINTRLINTSLEGTFSSITATTGTGRFAIPNSSLWLAGGFDSNSFTFGNPDLYAGAQIGTASNFFGIRSFSKTATSNYSTTVVMKHGQVGINIDPNTIGTTLGSIYNLNVGGACRLSNDGTLATGNLGVGMRVDASANFSNYVFLNGPSSTRNYSYTNYGINTINQGYFQSEGGSSNNWLETTKSGYTPSTISFLTGVGVTSQSRLFITAAGNVGIGTTAPTHTFDVAGNAHVSGTLESDTGLITSTITASTISAPRINVDILSTNVISYPLGSAAVPTITYNGDTNTGIFSPGADTVGITTAGNEVARFTSTGRLGIGLTLPLHTLDVSGNAHVTGTLESDTGLITSTITASTISAPRINVDILSTNVISYPLGSAAVPTITYNGDTNTGIFSPGADAVGITTAGKEVARFTSTGQLGIGISIPTSLLDVSGSATVRSRLVMPNGIAINSSSTANTGQATSAIAIGDSAGETNQGSGSLGVGAYCGRTNQGANATALGYSAGSLSQGISAIAIGNSAGEGSQGSFSVAIGSTAGQINQGTNAIAIGRLAGSSGQQANSIVLNASGSAINGDLSNATYIAPIRTEDSSVKRVMAYDTTTKEVVTTTGLYSLNGNVGIGTTPTAALDVSGGIIQVTRNNGSITLRPNGDTGGNVIRYGGPGINANNLIFMGPGDTEYMRISGGNVGIGTSTPTYKLDISGDVRISGSLIGGVAAPTTLSAVAGTVSAPSISFGGVDANGAKTGFYYPTTTAIGITTNAVERVRVDANGNVGIGTTTSDARLNVALTASSTTATANPTLRLDHADDNNDYIDFLTKASTGAFNSIVNTNDKVILFSDNKGNNSASGLAICPRASDTRGLRIDSNGRVGIGVSIPSYTLDVGGTFNLLPAGCIMMWATSTAPDKWLLCNGSAVSRTTYAVLFAAIGTTYGTGDGFTTFNLPDMRDRFPVGAGTTYSNNSKGGNDSITLTTAQLPSHSHTGTTDSGGAHTHNLSVSSAGYSASYNSSAEVGYATEINNGDITETTDSGGAHTHAFTTATTGSGSSIDIRPKYIGINYIIKI